MNFLLVLRRRLPLLLIISVAVGLFIFTLFTRDKSLINLGISVGISFMYSVVLFAGNGWINEYLNRIYSWIDNSRQRIIAGIISTLCINVVLVLLCNYVNFILVQGNNPANFFSNSMGILNWIIINIALLISAVLHAKSFMEEWKRVSRREVVEQKLIARSVSAQFESLKNQLDPHFLFNSLNVLSALIDENPAQAQHFTADMSKIYRYVLEQRDKEVVEVREEIEFARTYCGLLKTRFEDSVLFTFEVSEEVQNKYVVPLALQLLLENCIKHNFATGAKPLQVRIFSESDFLSVENTLQQREQVKESAGIGLSNIVQRYALLTRNNVIVEKSSAYFKVKLPLLTQKITAMNNENAPESAAYQRAAKRVKEIKGFYGNLLSYVLVIPFLVYVNLRTSPEYHWFWWPALGWGIGVLSHAFQVFGISRNWEERQIQRILEKEKQRGNGNFK